MNDTPNIVNIAALVGDHARAAMLTALMSGEALTATELSVEANVTKQTASAHLAKMKDAGLIVVATQGRHRYYRIAAPDVSELLEKLMGIAERTGATRTQRGPSNKELRHARVCYDHLAGELAVSVFDSFLERGFIEYDGGVKSDNPTIQLTEQGHQFCVDIGIELIAPEKSKRPTCHCCLDWSARRFHLAGMLGAGVLDYCYRQKLAKRIDGTRIVRFSAKGENELKAKFLVVRG